MAEREIEIEGIGGVILIRGSRIGVAMGVRIGSKDRVRITEIIVRIVSEIL